jgi:tetratricopeptide (TPR) repeat protein/transglutaminase-like putative cysteine protease
MLWRVSLLVLVCLALPDRILADEWPVARGPSHEPAPYKYNPKQSIPKSFEEATACVLYSGTTYIIEADDTLETITHEVTRLNSRKAIERLGEYRSISFDPSYQKLVLNEARVLKVNGKVVPIEPRHVHLRDVSTDFQVYDRDKLLVISFPNLEVGDIIEVKWSTRGKSPEFFGHFFTRYTFGDDRFPVVRDELRVRVPKKKTFHHAAINGNVPLSVRDEGASWLYHWRADNRAELPPDESLPSKEALRLQVACSTFASWAEVGQWKHKLRTQCWDCTPEIKEVVQEVTCGLTDPVDKARALTYWVRKRIRYVSISTSATGYTPQVPARTLANRFGDCKDQAQLLAVMLHEAGIQVELVTLGVLDDGQVVPDVPMPWGTHAILLATIDGQQHWIDTTVTSAPWDFLPRDDRDRIVYVTDNDKVRLLRTPKLLPSDNLFEMKTVVRVLASGSVVCKRSAAYHGSAAVNQRDTWFETAPAERRRLLTAELQDAYPKARLHWLRVDEKSLLDHDSPVRAQMEFAIPGQFSGTLDKEGNFSDSKVWARLLSYTVDPDRKVPLDLGSPFESSHHYVIQLPPAYLFDAQPAEQKIRSKWGVFHLKVRSNANDPRKLELIFHTRLDNPLVAPSDFAEFVRFQDEVHKGYRVWLSLSPTQDREDIPLLIGALLASPGDTASALVLVQLCREAGMTAEARDVLRWARLCQPDEASLWDLYVKLAATTDEQERTLAQMVKRFPDQPKYAVQLGGARVKLGDFAGAQRVLEPLTSKAPAAIQAQAHLELARSLLAQKKPTQALEHVLAAHGAATDGASSAQVALLQAEIHEQLDDVAKAGEAYRKALNFDPDNEQALAALVRLELNACHANEALVYLRRYTLAVGDNRDGLLQAATWYLELGRPGDALELALRAREQKFSAKTQRLLGFIYARQGDVAKAVFHLERADPDGEVLLVLLQSYLALGKLGPAIEACGQCDKFSKEMPELAEVAKTVRQLALRREALLHDMRVAAQHRAAWAEAVDAFLCADLAYREGRPASHVETLLARSLDQSVPCGPALALRGLLHLEQGRLSKALADAERALTLSPWEARAFYVRGRVLLERDQPLALLDLARAAWLSEQRDGKILHWLAAAQRRAGQRGSALATQRLALVLVPEDAEVLEQLGELQKRRQ